MKLTGFLSDAAVLFSLLFLLVMLPSARGQVIEKFTLHMTNESPCVIFAPQFPPPQPYLTWSADKAAIKQKETMIITATLNHSESGGFELNNVFNCTVMRVGSQTTKEPSLTILSSTPPPLPTSGGE